MILIRSFVFALGQLVSLIIMATLSVFVIPFSFSVRYAFMSKWARFVVWWARVVCGLRYEVQGAAHIDFSQPGLVLARHESAWETFALQCIFPRQAFVLKKELLRIPFFGWGMAMLNPIAIDRSAGRQALKQLISDGLDRFEKGDWVVIFPEGTRTAPGVFGQVKSGGAMLATKAKVPVYLVAHNAGQFWPKSSFLKQPGTISVFISPPIDVSDKSVNEVNTLIDNWFVEHLQPLEGRVAAVEAKETIETPPTTGH